MILFALKYWKYIGLVLGVLSLVTAALVYRSTLIAQGRNECRAAYETALNQAIIKADKSREKIEHENKNLDRDAIIHNLGNDGWLRNGE